MSNRLAGKVAIITGASNGLGRQIALTFHREGAIVVCSDIRETTNAEERSTHELIVEDGGKAVFVKADVSKATEVEALVEETVKQFGQLDM